MASGTYVGEESQFYGRHAALTIKGMIVEAQFDTGERWETHSRLNFSINEWILDEPK